MFEIQPIERTLFLLTLFGITYKYFENIKQAYFYWNNNIEEEKEGGPLNFVKN